MNHNQVKTEIQSYNKKTSHDLQSSMLLKRLKHPGMIVNEMNIYTQIKSKSFIADSRVHMTK
jgi:hypothetical protein